MNKEHAGLAVAKTLDSPEAIRRWRADPIAYLQQSGYSLSHLDDESRQVLRSYLANTEVRLVGFSFACTGCKILVGGTMVGLTAALATFIAGLVIASDGVDAAVAPEEVAAGAAAEEAAVAAETGLSAARVGEVIVTVLRGFVTWAKANPVKAAALVAVPSFAIEEIISDISEGVCEASGSCGG